MPRDEALGRPRSGFNTKIPAITDAQGNPLDSALTGGQASDVGQAARLVTPLHDGVEADKGYDSDALVHCLRERAIETVMPPQRKREEMHEYDRHDDKERHLGEYFFSKIKYYRRIFS